MTDHSVCTNANIVNIDEKTVEQNLHNKWNIKNVCAKMIPKKIKKTT